MIKKSHSLLKFHGVRGSRPVHASGFLGYGGNTTCLEIETGFDFILAIDCGTGLQHISRRLRLHPNRKKIHILLTHTHWDHVLMLPLLKELANPELEVSIHAPDIGSKTFSELFETMLKLGRLPIPKAQIKCKLTFHRIQPGQTFLLEGKVKVSTFQVNHQHITLGYKIGLQDGCIAVITDTALLTADNILGQGMNERALLIGPKNFEKEYNQGLIRFLKGVDCLVFDTHFNEDNLKPNWGHATPDLAINFCIKSGIKRLFLFHHAPEDNDDKVAIKQEYARNLALHRGIQVINAREEDEWPILSA